MSKLKLGVIFGGMSTEHDVSIVSGTSIIKNLNKDKYEIYPIYIDKEGNWFEYIKKVNEIEVLKVGEQIEELLPIENPVEYLKEIDLVFPVLHGLYGEDGTIQGMLELLKKKYVGCRVLSSSLCMDKVYTKIILEKANIPQADYMYFRKFKNQYIYIDQQFEEKICSLEEVCQMVQDQLGLPVFVKPSNSGSSVGINKSHNLEELANHIACAAEFDYKILVEKNIKGREVECSVLGNEEVKASCVGEILSAEEFYTFDAKYTNAKSKTVIPIDISSTVSEKIRNLAVKAFKAVDGKGLSRIDFFVEEGTQRVVLNEINTLPGFTQISMYPKLWEYVGISYSSLLDELIELALEE